MSVEQFRHLRPELSACWNSVDKACFIVRPGFINWTFIQYVNRKWVKSWFPIVFCRTRSLFTTTGINHRFKALWRWLYFIDAKATSIFYTFYGATTGVGVCIYVQLFYCLKKNSLSCPDFTAVYVVSVILAVATFGVILFMAYQKITKPETSSSLIKPWVISIYQL